MIIGNSANNHQHNKRNIPGVKSKHLVLLIFFLMFSPLARLALAENQNQPLPLKHPEKEYETSTKVNPASGDVLILANADYFPALLSQIKEAKTSIDLAMFVFKTTKSSKDRPSQIVKELIKASQWGVKVRIFLENSGYDEKLNVANKKTAEQLREQGIEVIFDSPNITTHTKLVVIDQRYSFVGSHNFTNSALKYNNEMSLLIDDQKLAKKLTAYMTGLTSR